jgi:ankyrin repeat protein
VLQVLAENGLNLNQPDKNGTTPAIIAALSGHAEALRVLAKNGVDLNQPNKNGFTPEFVAAEKGHKAALQVIREFKESKESKESKQIHANELRKKEKESLYPNLFNPNQFKRPVTNPVKEPSQNEAGEATSSHTSKPGGGV